MVEHRRIRSSRTPEQHQEHISRRNSRLLYFALSVALAATDAYVDAHLANFEAEVQVEMRRSTAWLRLKAAVP